MIPQSQVYFVPDPQIDVFFYGGYWWSPRGENWYRARAYNGPWGVVERNRVPRAVIYVPQDYGRGTSGSGMSRTANGRRITPAGTGRTGNRTRNGRRNGARK